MEAGQAAESDLKYALTEPEKGKEKQREEKASGEQPATWREVKKQRQMRMKAELKYLYSHPDVPRVPLSCWILVSYQ